MIKNVADPKVDPAVTAKINALLDELRSDHAMVKNDAQLCRVMKVAPPIISKLRNGHLNMSAEMMICIHEAFDLSIAYIKNKLGARSVNAVNPTTE